MTPVAGVTFRPAQVLLYQGRIGFVDFDSFCQAEPAMDLALFLSSLKDTGMRVLYGKGNSNDAALDPATCQARLAQMGELGEVFLAHYERHAAVSRQRVALWEACDLFTLLGTGAAGPDDAHPDAAGAPLARHGFVVSLAHSTRRGRTPLNRSTTVSELLASHEMP